MSIKVRKRPRHTYSKENLADCKRHFVKGWREAVVIGRRTPMRRRVKHHDISISRLDVHLAVKCMARCWCRWEEVIRERSSHKFVAPHLQELDDTLNPLSQEMIN